MTRRLLLLVLAVGLTTVLVGCGGDRERGVNSHKDRPRTLEKGE